MRDVIAAREKIVKETKLLRMMENAKKKERTQRNKMKRAVKAAMEKADSDTLLEDLEGPSRTITQNIMSLSKACIGQTIHHMWDMDGKDVNFFGTIINFKENLIQPKLVIRYSDPHNEDVVSKTEEVFIYEFIADVLMNDVIFM